MAGLTKLIALSSLVQAVYNRWRLPYLVAGAIALAILTIITSIMVCAALIAGFYAIFFFLAHNGWRSEDAALLVAGLIFLTAVFFILLTAFCMRYLRRLPHTLLKKTSTITAQTTEVFDAFMDGLLAEEAR